jgi:hypothetical protein
MQKWEYCVLVWGTEEAGTFGPLGIFKVPFSGRKPGGWLYKGTKPPFIEDISRSKRGLDEILKELGDEGWELVGVWGTVRETWEGEKFYFKRPKSE